MATLAAALDLLAALALGLSAGALLAEARVLVPFWRSQEPAAFLGWYRENAARLLRFFGPLEAASGVLVFAAVLVGGLVGRPGRVGMTVATALTLAVLASFPLYFQQANRSFEEATIPPERVPAELARWARWHASRTALAVAAFVAALMALGAD